MNSQCFNFNSVVEKFEFDSKPDKYQLEKNSQIIRFKNRTQVVFFLTDVPDRDSYRVFFLNDDGTKINLRII